MDQIIQVPFEESNRIPADLQLANLETHLKEMIPDLFINWTIHSPRDLLSFHIRNSYYRAHLRAESNRAPQGFEVFLMDVFVFDEDPYTS
jgi:hypothetical protein